VSTTKASPPETFEQTATAVSKRPITFPELFVVVNGCLPLVMLIYDAKHHQLGPNPISNALHTTGLISLLCLVATLSVSPLMKISKWKQLFYYRRPLGLLAFLYATAHVAIYVVYDRAWMYRDAWNEIVARRYLQFGALALVMMMPLAITSTPFWVWCLGFRNWKRLHRLIYPASIAAVIHYFLQARADTRLPLGMGGVLFGLLLLRLMPISRPKRNKKLGVVSTISEERQIGFHSIEFLDSMTRQEFGPDTTILEAAEAMGVALDSECRSGVCGTCRIQLIRGSVNMEVDSALSSEDKSANIILACQAKCLSDISVRQLSRAIPALKSLPTPSG
jgi:DMSO/TMAO reductase YedYZ heme-binding membrane subunit/ferredoxin